MAYCLSYIQSLSSPKSAFTDSHRRLLTSGWLRKIDGRRSSSPVVTSSIKCGFSGLNAPLHLNSTPGKYLTTVFLNNDKDCFDVGVKNQLELLAADRHQASARMCFSLGSDEATLHRRIAELKEHECQASVEEIIYMLVFSKFSELRVHLIPNLSNCICNGRLEIGPSKDWQLESIHNFDVLEMVKEHLTAVVGWKAYSSVTHSWETTQIQRLHLSRLYVASILYGYFLKSVSLRYRLEQSLGQVHSSLGIKTTSTSSHLHLPLPELWSMESMGIAFGCISSLHSTSVGEVACNPGKLKQYVMGFDQETMKRCAKLKSKEAVNVIERQSCALFRDVKTGSIESSDMICISFSSSKRFVLEGIAFGSFLWESEKYVDSIYKLEENSLD